MIPFKGNPFLIIKALHYSALCIVGLRRGSRLLLCLRYENSQFTNRVGEGIPLHSSLGLRGLGA